MSDPSRRLVPSTLPDDRPIHAAAHVRAVVVPNGGGDDWRTDSRARCRAAGGWPGLRLRGQSCQLDRYARAVCVLALPVQDNGEAVAILRAVCGMASVEFG